MSSTFDISRFPNLPPEVLRAFETQQAALEASRMEVEASRMEVSVERAARLHQEAVLSEKESLIATLKELIEKLEGQVGQYRRAKFGPKSEKLHPDQLQLALEDIETAIAETQEQIAAVEKQIEATQAEQHRKPRKPRKERKLPDNLPRVEQVIEPESIACPCGCGDMVRIGEDRSERLDIIPARYQVIVTIRPRYACPRGRTGVLQAAAPAHLLEGSWPTEALLAHIAVANGLTLIITDTGFAAIGIEGENQKTKAQKSEPKPAATERRTREGTKQALVIEMLRRPEGASIAEIVEATAWVGHSVRGFLAGALKKKLGLTIDSEKDATRGRVYKIVH